MWAAEKLEKQIAALQNYPDAGFSITGGYNFKGSNEPLEYFYKQREGVKYGDIFISFFRSEASIFPQTLMLRRSCLPVILRSVETSPHSDVEFLIDLAINFKAVILYEPLLYRRLHNTGFSIMNWERGYYEGIHVINAYKNNGKLPSKMARDALFRLYIHSGEKYLSFKKKGKAVRCFLKAWANKPFSIVPLKKIAKAALG
jgi:hypothetical protein